MHLGSGANAPGLLQFLLLGKKKTLYGLDGRLSFEMKTVPSRYGEHVYRFLVSEKNPAGSRAHTPHNINA